MKRAPSVANVEIALLESSAEPSVPNPQHGRRRFLLDQLAEAGRQNDRAEFDRLFDHCFERVYSIAWRVTRNRGRAEAITSHILRDAVSRAT